MSARRTPWWHYAVGIVLGLVFGGGVALIGEANDLAVVGAPWIVPIVLGILGVVVFAMAWQVRQYVKGKRKYLNPAVSVYALVLSKALGLAAAALLGWYAGQLLVSLGHADAPFYANAMVECGVSAVVCIADLAVGIVGEWFCQLPPNEGPEHPKAKAAERQRKLAAASPAPAESVASRPERK
ncbi:DUF3180 domain-containing protein [Bifidobacterium avesanii]|uniref:DUF3180 family protein n=1 Tax=Bifidobacterium avesanii TaxID=1798157 RepID=A0A7K3TKE5_9BIFI|nr:DUF3180 domain-containing protein [Bifidobacterium avesanii]KAB8289591.1 hypothetical protein DSM100685_1663 [Bifidobacterium avesanii]NEG79144.1 DUF3180 family protein [Bifidobacterium avesanii]